MGNKSTIPLCVRPYRAGNDYAMVSQWWAAHEWPPIPEECLSSFSLVVTSDKDPICAGWLYWSDSKIAWIEWVVANPKAPARTVHASIGVLLTALKEEAKRRHAQVIFSSLRSKGLIKIYQRAGFVVTDTAMTNVVFRWQP